MNGPRPVQSIDDQRGLRHKYVRWSVFYLIRLRPVYILVYILRRRNP
jgi:hypothetical protein